MTNREWLESLSNKQLAEFLTCGLYVHDLREIEGNLPEGAVYIRGRIIDFNSIKRVEKKAEEAYSLGRC